MSAPSWVPALRPRPRDTHKGAMGRLLVVGGSPGLTGAVALAAQAAMRSGVGLVTCAVPASVHAILAAKLLEAMSLPLPDRGSGALLPEAATALGDALRNADALVVGPGMGRTEASTEFLHALLEGAVLPHVVDADGLWHLARSPAPLLRGHAARILTPHWGEMQRLLDAVGIETRERASAAAQFAGRVPGVLVLKGAGTIVQEGAKARVNPTGNPGMATGGTGDVLAGMLGAFLARGDRALDAALRAVWLHGRAGDLAAAEVGEECLIASDIIAALQSAFREVASC